MYVNGRTIRYLNVAQLNNSIIITKSLRLDDIKLIIREGLELFGALGFDYFRDVRCTGIHGWIYVMSILKNVVKMKLKFSI